MQSLLFSHHSASFFFHDDGIDSFLIFGLVAEGDGDDVAKEIEVSSVDRASEGVGFGCFYIDYLAFVFDHFPNFDPTVLYT
jgi:hypothetical protein